MSNPKILLTQSKVEKRHDGRGYQVVQLHPEDGIPGVWRPASKIYGHSTSAFAALGRLMQKEMIEQ
jgi:hypothetical protein